MNQWSDRASPTQQVAESPDQPSCAPIPCWEGSAWCSLAGSVPESLSVPPALSPHPPGEGRGSLTCWLICHPQNGLMVACYAGFLDIVVLLSGCPYVDINHQDNDGNTALMIAAQAGRHQPCQELPASLGPAAARVHACAQTVQLPAHLWEGQGPATHPGQCLGNGSPTVALPKPGLHDRPDILSCRDAENASLFCPLPQREAPPSHSSPPTPARTGKGASARETSPLAGSFLLLLPKRLRQERCILHFTSPGKQVRPEHGQP